MAAGGSRPGAGRPKGSLNKRTQELLARLKTEIGEDSDPIMVLARFMVDESYPAEFRADCAAKIAPYVHSRLKQSEVEIQGDPCDGLAERIWRAQERERLAECEK